MDKDGMQDDNALQEPGAATPAKGVVLAHDDILSADSILLADIGAIPGAPNDIAAQLGGVPEQVALQPEELLSGTGATAVEGGFLTFDSDSSPGNTIVRVVFDGLDAQEAVEVGLFKGGGMDINSLLGLLGTDDAHHL